MLNKTELLEILEAQGLDACIKAITGQNKGIKLLKSFLTEEIRRLEAASIYPGVAVWAKDYDATFTRAISDSTNACICAFSAAADAYGDDSFNTTYTQERIRQKQRLAELLKGLTMPERRIR